MTSAQPADAVAAATPDAAAAGGPSVPQDGQPAVGASRACDACGAIMAADQDWCLQCGTAAPGRLGARPGVRAMLTVIALTLLLAGGAVAASYAALSQDAKVQAAQPAPAPASPVAQLPPTLPPSSAPPAVVTPVAPATTLPTVKAPKATTVPVAKPVTTPTITPVTPSSTTTTTTTTPTDTTTDQEDDTATTTPAVKAIDLGADTVAVYDPYKRVSVKGDPLDAYDGDADTTFRIGTQAPDTPMNVGIVIDLEKTTTVRVLELLTDTPGYRVEIYGTTSSTLPPDILDARWEHLTDRSKVDADARGSRVAGDDKERIPLGGRRRIRYLNLWLTTPPTKAPTVRIAELKLFA